MFLRTTASDAQSERDGRDPSRRTSTSRSSAAASPASAWRSSSSRRAATDFVVLERDGDVGGTWRQNTYPGCQCDVPSNLYSFSFAPNPDWTPDVRAAARDRRLPAQGRRRLRRAPVHPHSAPTVTGAALGRGGAALARRDHRAARSPRASSSPAWAALSEPAIPRIPGLETLRGPGLPLRRAGTTTSTCAASASR